MSLNVSSPILSFKSSNPVKTVSCDKNVCKTCGKEVDDSFKASTPNVDDKSPKKGFGSRLKDSFINFRKAVIDVTYILGGAIKGALYGGLTAAGVAGGVAVKNIVQKAPKTLGIGGKIIAGVVGLAVMGGTIFNAKLDANERKAQLDHRWETGHND